MIPASVKVCMDKMNRTMTLTNGDSDAECFELGAFLSEEYGLIPPLVLLATHKTVGAQRV